MWSRLRGKYKAACEVVKMAELKTRFYDFLKQSVEKMDNVELNGVLKYHGLSPEDADRLLPLVCDIVEEDPIMLDISNMLDVAVELHKATLAMKHITSSNSSQIVDEYLDLVRKASIDFGVKILDIGNSRIMQVVSDVQRREKENVV